MQIFFGISSARAQEGLKLWYDKPAGEWVEALPVGNGRIGAMVFGGVSSELIRLNESSLWSGCPVQDSLNIDAPCYLPLIRKLFSRAIFLRLRKVVGSCRDLIVPVIFRWEICISHI